MAVGSVRYGQLNRSFVYSYTPQGNISAVCDGDRQSTYQYDEINQLIRENNAYLNKTVTYSYDAGGKIERGFGRNEGTLGEDRKTPDQALETPVRAKFEPKQPKIRRPGTGCLFQISPKKWEGSYSPKMPNDKRKKFNIYADTREEYEEKLAVMIAEKNAEIAAEKERLKAERKP